MHRQSHRDDGENCGILHGHCGHRPVLWRPCADTPTHLVAFMTRLCIPIAVSYALYSTNHGCQSKNYKNALLVLSVSREAQMLLSHMCGFYS